MSKIIHTPAMDQLCDAFLSMKNREEMYSFLEDLCTVKEIAAMAQRFEVATLLQDGETYQKIASETGASTATISRVNRAFNYGDDGYSIALQRTTDKK